MPLIAGKPEQLHQCWDWTDKQTSTDN